MTQHIPDRPYMTHGYYRAHHGYKSSIIECLCGVTFTELNVRIADRQMQRHLQEIRDAKSNREEAATVQG